jgi:hypothetical protein
MNKHILFYSIKCKHCNNLLSLLNNNDDYTYISVDNNNKIPKIIDKVPTLIINGINKPLVGKEVFTWISTQKYLNINTNNINTVKNPTFKADEYLANTFDLNYVSLLDNEEETNKNIVNFNKMNNLFITEDINKIIEDNKINEEMQNKKLSQLLNNRNNQLDMILNLNKKLT